MRTEPRGAIAAEGAGEEELSAFFREVSSNIGRIARGAKGNSCCGNPIDHRSGLGLAKLLILQNRHISF